MIKLEEKLIELGYTPLGYGCGKYDWCNGIVYITLNLNKTEIIDAFVKSCAMRYPIELEYNIQAFNQLQKDLEVLKEYETKVK